MTDVFALDTSGQQDVAAEAARTAVPADQISPGFWHGTGEGVGEGVMRGGARVGQMIGLAAAAPVSIYERLTGQEGEYTDRMFQFEDDVTNSAVDFWTPGTAEVGTAGRILGGLSEITLPLMAGGGNPALMIASQEAGTATDLARQGASSTAAVAVGAIQGAAGAVGFRLPFLGSTLATRMASGAAGNLAVNAGSTAASHTVLQAAGNDQAAASFDATDAEARAVDVLTGIAFGGIAHVSIRSAERNAALAAANARHFQDETAPGTPADINASVAHQQAMESAITALIHGEPVAVPDKVLEANFVPRETDTAERTQALADEGITALDESRIQRRANVADARVDSALEYLTKKGGVNLDEAASEGLDPADMRDVRVGIRRGFNRKGMSLETAGEQLAQAGYPVTDQTGAVDKNLVLDMIGNEVRGTKAYSINRDSAEIAHDFAQQESVHQEAQAPAAAPVPENIASLESLNDAQKQQLAQHYHDVGQAKPEFDATLAAIGKGAGSPHLPKLAKALKSVTRAAEKISADYRGDVSRLKNVLRGTIVVDSPEQASRAVDLVMAHFGEPVGDPCNALREGVDPVSLEGYRDAKLNVNVGDHVAEVQISVPEMLVAKKEAHPLYKEWQKLDRQAMLENRDLTPEETAQAKALLSKQREIYAVAWADLLTRSRKAASETSVPLWAKDEAGNLRPSGTSQARQTSSGVQEQGTPSTSAKSVPAGNDAGKGIRDTSGGSIASRPTAGRGIDILAAQQLLAGRDYEIPTGAVDADGIPMTRSARELMAEAEAETARAEEMGHAIQAAAACFLGTDYAG